MDWELQILNEMKAYYSDEFVTLYCGDNREILPQIEPIDLVVTSPPYDDLRTYGGGLSWDFKTTACLLAEKLKEGGVITWVVGDETKDGTESGSSFEQGLFFKYFCKLRIHDTMIFEKHNFSNPSHTRYHQLFEYMLILSKGRPRVFNPIKDHKNKYTRAWGKNTFRDRDGELKERNRREYKEYGMRGNIWRYIVGNVNGDDKIAYQHPAIFPEQLAHDHITTWSNEGDHIVDPFGGSGTVAKIARLRGRKCTIIESKEEYCELIAKRLAQAILNFHAVKGE